MRFYELAEGKFLTEEILSQLGRVDDSAGVDWLGRVNSARNGWTAFGVQAGDLVRMTDGDGLEFFANFRFLSSSDVSVSSDFVVVSAAGKYEAVRDVGRFSDGRYRFRFDKKVGGTTCRVSVHVPEFVEESVSRKTFFGDEKLEVRRSRATYPDRIKLDLTPAGEGAVDDWVMPREEAHVRRVEREAFVMSLPQFLLDKEHGDVRVENKIESRSYGYYGGYRY